MRAKLTVKFVKNATCPEGKDRVFFQDEQTRGLSLCVLASGARVYYRTGRVQGKNVRTRIAAANEITLEEARQACEKLSGEIAMGKNPHLEKIATRSGKTIQEVFDWDLEHHLKQNRSWIKDLKRYENHISKLSHRRITELTTQEIRELVSGVSASSGKYAARNVLKQIRAMLNRAKSMGWLTENPCDGIADLNFGPRERFLKPDEVQAFFDAVNEVGGVFRDPIFLSLFTGVRRSNVLSMRWAELDLDNELWIIPSEKAKGGKTIVVPLVPQALAILQSRRRRSEWVFPSRSLSGHLMNPSDALRRIRKHSGIDDFRFHDLRRTIASWQSAAGTSLEVISKSLGHGSQRTTKGYVHIDLSSVRPSMERAAERLESVAKKKSENSPN